jgi:hypothetical protein
MTGQAQAKYYTPYDTPLSDSAHGQRRTKPVPLRTQFKPAAHHDDGLLGSLLLSLLAGPAFAGAINDNFMTGGGAALSPELFNLTVAFECASEMLIDSERRAARKHRPEIAGSGTFAMGEHKTSCNRFPAKTHDSRTHHFEQAPLFLDKNPL